MKKTWIILALAMLMIVSFVFACCNPQDGNKIDPSDNYVDYNPNKQPGGDQFDFPGNYAAPELTINGKADDAVWETAKTLATFGHGDAATIKAYRGEKAIFFFVEVTDTILLTEGETNDDAVTRSDSIEIYIDSLADGGSKPQNDDYQINLGIHGKTRIMQGSGSGWGGWNGLIDYEVQLNGTLNDGIEANDTGYTVEVMIPYAQIGIEKNDTIAVSFGQVDKVNLGSSAMTDWDWFGWTYNGVATEPQAPNNYVLLDKDNNLLSRDQEVRPNADIAGYVLDHTTNNAIQGVTVTVVGADDILPVETDEQGYFEFKQVSPEQNYTLSFEKDGYFGNNVVYTRAELRQANGGRVLKNITIRDKDTVAKTTIEGTVKNIVNGVVANAVVTVDGTDLTATTNESGAFTLAGVPAEYDITLSVSATGYGTSTTVISSQNLVANDTSALGDININLAYGLSGGFGLKSDRFADSTMQVSRALTGIEFLFSGTRQLSGHLELYLDVKDSADHRKNDATAWRFDLDGNGTLVSMQYMATPEGEDTNIVSSQGLVYTLYHNDTTGYSAKLFVPYSYVDIAPLEVFGISLGQWSTTANDWDGWAFNGQFIAPEIPQEYVRVSATNELYRSENNNSMVNISGNVGIAGVRVDVGGASVVSGADGSWSVKVTASAQAMDVVYTRQGYQTHTTTIPENYFDTHYFFYEEVTMELQKVTISGTVTDQDGAVVEGVTVTIDGTELTATTDAEGKYTIANVETLQDALIRFNKQGYDFAEKSVTAVVLAGATTHTVDAQIASQDKTHYVTLSGKVVDVNGALAGATVSVVGRSDLTATTGDDGTFTIANFPVVDCYLAVELADYLNKQVYFDATRVDADATTYTLADIRLVHSNTVLTGTVKNVAYGAVAGATVTVEGTTLSATTNSDGTFEIADVPTKQDIVLVVTGANYVESKTTIKLDALNKGGNTRVGDVNLSLPHADTGAFGGKNDAFANSTMKLTRTLTGIEVTLSGTRQLHGQIEFYFDVKECAAHRDQDATAWRFDLCGDGTIGGTHFAGGALVQDGLVYNLYSNTAEGYSAYFFIPYSYLGIEPTEVFGFSLGQWSTVAINNAGNVGDWDGWSPSWSGFVAPETPATYMRMSATNELYVHNANDSLVTLHGNVGMEGVTISVGGATTTSGADGNWSIRIASTTEQIAISYTNKGYVAQSYTVPADTFVFGIYSHTVPNVTLTEQKVSISGTLTDSKTNAPVVGATVTIVGTDLSATTDADGNYTIANVGTFNDVTLKIEATNYAAQEKTLTAVELSASETHTVDAALVSTNQIKYLTLNGTVTNVNGPIVGATVSVVGNSELTATTGADGTFAIDNFAGIDCVISITKDGYIAKEISFKADSLQADADSHDIGTQDLMLNYATLYGLIADKADTFAAFQGYVTRSAVGFEFKFVGSRAFTGRIELFVDTKTSAGDNARDTSDYLFNLNADGTVTIVNWGDGTKNEAKPDNMILTVDGANTATPTVNFTLPYAFFGQIDASAGITATEVIGISAGQWNGSDWDGWDCFALYGVGGGNVDGVIVPGAFVKPEMPTDYIRIGANNEIYNHVSNDTLNLNDYQIHFGTGYNCENNPVGVRTADQADNFYAKVSKRDATGVTFDFITTGDFGKFGDVNEMVLVYFDTGSVSGTGGWSPDYLIKVESDGTVYGKAGAWWPTTAGDKIGEVTITRQNGVTTFSLTVAYTTIGVTESEIFGIAMREGYPNENNHVGYEPWWDCYFNKGTDIGYPGAGIDAANDSQFIRVAADGTLYRAANNNAQ